MFFIRKKFLLVLAMVLFFTSAAGAQEWTYANQATVAWDAVETLENGSPIPAGDVIKYRVYIKGVDASDGVVMGDTPETQYTITFENEGRFLAGVQTVRVPAGAEPGDEITSAILWSDSEEVEFVPDPFGFVYYILPNVVSQLVRQ